MYVNNLVIEITRRCNLKCSHCLRGDVEKIDISDEVLDATFSGISHVDTLTITGGEPGLALDRIEQIINHIHFKSIVVDEIYMVSNLRKYDTSSLT